MEQEDSKDTKVTPTVDELKPSIMINDLEYTYSIKKLEDKEGLIIKLSELIPKTNIYYVYEVEASKLITDIKLLSICEDIEDMINTLEDIFLKGNAIFIEEENKYYIKLIFSGLGKKRISKIELTKHVPKESKDQLTDLNDKIHELDFKYNNLIKEIDGLKIIVKKMILTLKIKLKKY